MQQYFAYDYSGPAFELFGAGHLVYLLMMATAVAFLIWGWRDPSEEGKRRARLLIAGILLLLEVSWHGWNLLNDAWSYRQHLPLHSCAISVWGSIYVVWARSYRVYEILFFMGTAGALQTLLTPDAGEVRLRGEAVRFSNPHEAMQRGIAMIHQELMPVPEMSVAENLMLGREPKGRIPGTIDRRKMEIESKRLLETEPARELDRRARAVAVEHVVDATQHVHDERYLHHEQIEFLAEVLLDVPLDGEERLHGFPGREQRVVVRGQDPFEIVVVPHTGAGEIGSIVGHRFLLWREAVSAPHPTRRCEALSRERSAA